MRSFGLRILTVLLVASALAACSQDAEPQLMSSPSNGNKTPDEFTILPNKPLQQPENFSELPTPTPYGRNRTDVTPVEDAATALGGDPMSASSSGIPSADRQLVRYADRFGRQEDIRAELAAEDLELRRQNQGRVLERMLNVNVYFRAYEDMTLDQYAELERFRALGVRTPAAPPESGADG